MRELVKAEDMDGNRHAAAASKGMRYPVEKAFMLL
jgi:hypothetical protein